MKTESVFHRYLATFVLITITYIFGGVELIQSKFQEPNPSALSVGQVSWMKFSGSAPSPVSDPIFAAKGEQVIMVLENVGKFKEGKGKHWFEIDIFIEAPDGKRVFPRRNILES